jgi:2-iminobutanoate/2-iminopropanoate deaminase
MRTIGAIAAAGLCLYAAACARADREVILTDAAPAPIGPYSQAVRVADTLYVSGQLGIAPGSRALVEGGVATQTQQAMKNVGAILAAAGFTFADVVQVQLFLEDMDDYGAVNGIYRTFFHENPPARAAVEVADLPLDAKVEVLVVAVRGGR